MEVLSFVFLMLVAILASNLINRFLPSVSTPIIQIALGALIGISPLPYHLELEPEWFFVLFIAPLLFYDALVANKQALWAQRKPIFLIAFGLVFLTVLLIGYFTNLLIPSMPLAAAFALAAAITPTDAVAVGSLAKRIHIPHNIRHVLEGESLINDASGLVSFQFAVAAMVTGVFSLVDAGVELVVVVVGGILVGAVLSWFKYLLVRWVRSLGMEDVTFHLLVGILTPFVIYLVAEHFHVSGILAVVTAGILHSFEARRINPDVVSLRIASESVWQALVYVLNGLVFVILGTQLPEILESVRLNAQIDGRIVLVDVLAITAALMLIRFGWAYFTLPRESLVGESKPLSRVRAGLVTTMAGVRGAVTLASALSLPFVLADGSPFPFRETIIFIASMVILLSLLIANFLLPLLLDSATEHGSAEELTDARIDLLQGVVRRLNAQSTSENAFATSQMVREYYVRISELENKRGWSRAERELEAKLHQQALEWEKENTLSYIEQNHLDAERTEGLLDFIDASSREWRKRATPVYRRVTRYLNFFRSERRFQGSEADHMIRWQDTHAILHSNTAYVMQHLRALEDATNRRVVDKMVADYELAADLFEQRFAVVTGSKLNQTAGAPAQDGLHIAEVTKLAMQLERDGIQSLFEEGRISRAAAAEMRNNLGMVALRLQQQFFLEEEDLAPA